MTRIQAFRALRPADGKAADVASPPYDVLSTEEARAIVSEHPHSFLRVIRAEVAFAADADPYSKEVYAKGGSVLKQYQDEGTLQQESKPCLYIYRQQMGEQVQTGLVAGASCAEYDKEIIRKHEFTRPTKEKDRVRHIETLKAQTGPVWLAYRSIPQIDQKIKELTIKEPSFQFTAPDEVIHTGWVVDQDDDIALLQTLFESHVPLLYIADGHHRSAAASQVAQIWRDQYGADAEHPSQFFLSVIYPHNQLNIMAYNRHVHDLNGLTPDTFLGKLLGVFDIDTVDNPAKPNPQERHHFAMYLDGEWHQLKAKPGTYQESDPIESLDVQILQKRVLEPLLGIQDPRTSDRISFVGGTRGHQELERLVQQNGGVAFACYPTSIDELFRVADANQVMPPKSTWFAPKLRSGLFTYLLDG